MKDIEYWSERAELLENEIFKDTLAFEKRMNEVFAANVKEIENEMISFIAKYATDNKITYAEASKNLTVIEMSEYNQVMNNLLREYRTNGSPELLARIKHIEARATLTRLDALKNQMEARIAILTEQINGDVEKFLTTAYTKTFDETCNNYAIGLNIDNAFTTLNPVLIEKIIKYPYSGMLFSDRIWKCTDKLNSSLLETLQLGMAQGKSIPQMSHELNSKLKTKGVRGYSNYDINRVIRTETAFIQEQAIADSNNRYGFKKFYIITAKDERTCRRCGRRHGEEHLETERVAGVTAPPFHPQCRCCTAPVPDSYEPN